MPSAARISAALGVAAFVAVTFVLWVGWPVPASVIIGAVFGAGFFASTAITGKDPRAADAAWRAGTADLPFDGTGTRDDVVPFAGVAPLDGADADRPVADGAVEPDRGTVDRQGGETGSGPRT